MPLASPASWARLAFPPRARKPRPHPVRLARLWDGLWLAVVETDTVAWRVEAACRPGSPLPVPRHTDGEAARCAHCHMGRACPVLAAGALCAELDMCRTLRRAALAAGDGGMAARAGRRDRAIEAELGRRGHVAVAWGAAG